MFLIAIGGKITDVASVLHADAQRGANFFRDISGIHFIHDIFKWNHIRVRDCRIVPIINSDKTDVHRGKEEFCILT